MNQFRIPEANQSSLNLAKHREIGQKSGQAPKTKPSLLMGRLVCNAFIVKVVGRAGFEPA
jgi:hypothetical protein